MGGLLGCLLAASLVAAPVTSAASGRSLSTYQAQERQVTGQLSAAQAAYSADLADWQRAQVALTRADAALRAAATRLDAITRFLMMAEQRLAQLAQEVARAKAVVAVDEGRADGGLTVLYEHGTVSFVDVLFGASSFSDFLTRLGLLKRIWNLEMGYLRQAERAQANLQALEAEQSSAVSHLAGVHTAAQIDLADMRQQEGAAASANAQANAAVAAASSVVDSLVAQRNGLEAQIQKIIAELASGKASWSAILSDIHVLASQYGIDPLLVEAVVLQESGGQANARSTAGAIGLMQLMPGTASALGISNAYNPVQNLRGGITYLLEMLNEFHGNLKLALAAYNAGPYAVKEFGGIPPYQQTQNYVNDVLAIYSREK